MHTESRKDSTLDPLIDRAASLAEQADALVVAAGAGMGVDSGLPDFRGKEGFWRAYPALGHARIDFYSIASPSAFRSAPERAWGFTPDVDENDCRLRNSAPVCPTCGALARPNILMFGDGGWVERRSAAQALRQEAWLSWMHPALEFPAERRLEHPAGVFKLYRNEDR